jgi:DNA-binding HxlR family transcriptional regulator
MSPESAPQSQMPGIDATLEMIGGKWKIQILWSLKSKAKRFSDIKEEVQGITQKMLTQQLKEFVRDGIATRKSYPEIPPRVEYKLTDYGKSLIPVLEAMNKWGEMHLAKKWGIEPVSATGKSKKTVAAPAPTQQLGLF